MSAVLGAFVQYIITFILLVAAAAGGIFCGKKLRTKKNMESNTAGNICDTTGGQNFEKVWSKRTSKNVSGVF